MALDKTYDPTAVEKRWFPFWMEGGYFRPEKNPSGQPFSIVIPPPNITGSLHMGHALNNTLQDILCRYKRMDGYRVLWVPGTDHAGIATKNVVERRLAAGGEKPAAATPPPPTACGAVPCGRAAHHLHTA